MTISELTPAGARIRIEALALTRSGLAKPSHDPAKFAEALRAVLREPEGKRLYEISVGRTPPPPRRPTTADIAVGRADDKARAERRPGEAYAYALRRVLADDPNLYEQTRVQGPPQGMPSW